MQGDVMCVCRCGVFQRATRHQRAEVGTANPDIHHVTNWLAGKTSPLSGTNPAGQLIHAGKLCLDSGMFLRQVANGMGGAQQPVHCCTLLASIYLAACKQGINCPAQVGIIGQLAQQRHSILVNALFAENNINICAQSLMTKGDVGYLVIDVEDSDSEVALEKIQGVAGTLRVRVLY